MFDRWREFKLAMAWIYFVRFCSYHSAKRLGAFMANRERQVFKENHGLFVADFYTCPKCI